LRLLSGNRIQAILVDRNGVLDGAGLSSNTPRATLTEALDPGTVARLRRHPGVSERVGAGPDAFRVAYRPLQTTALDRETGTATPVGGVIVAVSQRADDETLHQFVVNAVLVTSVALVTLVLLAMAVLRVGLRSLQQTASAAAAIANGDRTRRIHLGHPDSEATQLAMTLNQAFDQQFEAEARLRRFVADVSHELRTPLSTIGGWADLYFHGGLTDQEATRTAMSRIADEAASMRSLVEELLLLANLDQQRSLKKERVPLSTLVDEVVSDARVIDPSRHITLSVRSPAGDPATVVGDADRIRQLVRNLLSNALQHTLPGTSVHVTVSADVDSSGVPQMNLAVADRGPSIPAEARTHLFDRFYQFSQHGPIRRRGNGLGLAIAHAIVEAHGGTITLRPTADGAGNEFVVSLPSLDPTHDPDFGDSCSVADSNR
jgi:two-component system OmpR family sensor kinase